MALVWFFIFAAAGGVLWYCQTKMTISQRRKIVLNFALLVLLIGFVGAAYELVAYGYIGQPPGD